MLAVRVCVSEDLATGREERQERQERESLEASERESVKEEWPQESTKGHKRGINRRGAKVAEDGTIGRQEP